MHIRTTLAIFATLLNKLGSCPGEVKTTWLNIVFSFSQIPHFVELFDGLGRLDVLKKILGMASLPLPRCS